MTDIDRYWNIIRYCIEEKNISNIGEIKSKYNEKELINEKKKEIDILLEKYIRNIK